MLRQYHDTLSTNLDRLQEFLNETTDVFGKQDDFEDQCGCYLNIIVFEITHLNRWRRRLQQRMERFESMRDGLLNSSALRESRLLTKQGDDIGLLTMVTVVYLPVGLASSIFGISGSLPPAVMWYAWLGTSAFLSVATACFAFRKKVMMYLSKGRGKTL
jgi:Mg2+ and Co2+ transporter CorA